jgi:hypothetical protein
MQQPHQSKAKQSAETGGSTPVQHPLLCNASKSRHSSVAARAGTLFKTAGAAEPGHSLRRAMDHAGWSLALRDKTSATATRVSHGPDNFSFKGKWTRKAFFLKRKQWTLEPFYKTATCCRGAFSMPHRPSAIVAYECNLRGRELRLHQP